MSTKRKIIQLGGCICSINKGIGKRVSVQSVRSLTSQSSGVENETPIDFSLNRALLMRKITRYQYEKQWNSHLNEQQLKAHLTSKGSDYDGLIQRHDEYYKVLDDVYEYLQKKGVDVKMVQRFDYDENFIDWADAVFTVGGDGTFLMAASKMKGQSKPVIGINADPVRSEGYLCLPKSWSLDFKGAIDRVMDSQFKWMWRQRIRLTMSGKHSDNTPVDLHAQELHYPEHRFLEHVKEHETLSDLSNTIIEKPPKILPILALNEVFIGESLSARVSFYEISIDESERVKQKSSGITVCTGTGSTSWFFNINHIPKQSVKRILDITKSLGKGNICTDDELLIRKITKEFNSSLTFNPSDKNMAYVVRDPVARATNTCSQHEAQGIFQVNNPRGFCSKMTVKSRMWDAWVVVDGGISFKFNDGAVVDLEMLDEDALRCICLE